MRDSLRLLVAESAVPAPKLDIAKHVCVVCCLANCLSLTVHYSSLLLWVSALFSLLSVPDTASSAMIVVLAVLPRYF